MNKLADIAKFRENNIFSSEECISTNTQVVVFY